MERNIEKYLVDWKKNPDRKPLILRGARQVGKTYSIDKFAKENYRYYLKINIEQDSILKNIFDSKQPSRIIDELTVLYQIPLLDSESLLFIDEIQMAPNAIAALRYFYEERPGLHVIAAGSLLDHTLNEMKYSMPVGRVEFAYMYPLNFNEFLQALGQIGLVKALEKFTPTLDLSTAIHEKLKEYLRLYFFIGGMPEAVNAYVKHQDLLKVEKVHSDILSSIEYDFAKYGTRKQQEYLKDVLRYCANNIGQKVRYVNINKAANSEMLKDALYKLGMSRIIHLVHRTKSSEVPLSKYEDKDVFKPLFMDIGLACRIAGIKLTDMSDLAADFEGALAEQFVGQEMIAAGDIYSEQKLYYWQRDAKNANAEIDYLYQIDNRIFPLEVKAGKRGTLKSLHVFLAEKNKDIGIRLNLDLPSFGENLTANPNLPDKETISYKLLSLPLYFAGKLKHFGNILTLQ